MSDEDEELEEPFQDSGSEYVASSTDLSSDESEDIRPSTSADVRNKNRAIAKKATQEIMESNGEESDDSEVDDEIENSMETEEQVLVRTDKWQPIDGHFTPRKNIPAERPCNILLDLDRGSSELDVFFKLFPKSLFLWIAE